MPNWCSLSMHVKCTTEQGAEELFDDIKLRQSISDEKDEGMSIGSEDRYLFFSESDIYKDSVLINGSVKWCVHPDEFESMVNFILDRTAVYFVNLRYEELGCGEYGEFIYEDDKITHRYLPADCFTDELFESELIGDALDSLLSTRAVVDVVKKY